MNSEREMNDSPTNRQTGSYLDELMKELQSMTNIYESNHNVNFRNAQNLLIREIQRVLDAEHLMKSLGTKTPPRRFVAGRDIEMPTPELSSITNFMKEDASLMTPSPANGSSLRRRQSFSPLTLSLIGATNCIDKEVEEEKKEQGKIQKCDKIFFPKETPTNINPIGRLIGPRGITIRQLETDLGCKLFIRGKGCTRDDSKEERLRGRAGWEHLDEPIHVLITVNADSEDSANDKMQQVKTYLQDFLENNDSNLKRAQLMQLAVIEGTLK